jgi:hypothetical protein
MEVDGTVLWERISEHMLSIKPKSISFLSSVNSLFFYGRLEFMKLISIHIIAQLFAISPNQSPNLVYFCL